MEIITELDVPQEWRGFGWPWGCTVRWQADGVDYEASGVVTEEGPLLQSVRVTGHDLYGLHLRAPVVAIWREALAEVAVEARAEGEGYAAHEGVKRRVPVRRGRSLDPLAAVNRLDEIPSGATATEVAEHFDVSVSYARRLIGKLAG